MLIISCRLNQGLVIGKELKVRIIGVRGKQVRLGVEAPRDVAVHRQEVVDRIAADAKEICERN
jgi:carbon storage regulator